MHNCVDILSMFHKLSHNYPYSKKFEAPVSKRNKILSEIFQKQTKLPLPKNKNQAEPSFCLVFDALAVFPDSVNKKAGQQSD